jgi:predicted Rossmann fold flavoprotein
LSEVILSEQSLNILVIGGGAAGFFGAIAAAKHSPHARVTLLEAGRQFLSKVLISGGGRCNVTHSCFDPAVLVQHYPRGGKALRGAFSQFQPRHTVEWFESRGVKLKTEEDGRMFPITDNSETIANCLLNQAKNIGIELRTQSPVQAIAKVENQFQVELRSREVLQCDRVLIATGSSPQGHRFAESLGHTIERPVPSLFTFNIKDERLKDLLGISVNPVQLRIQEDKTKLEQTGAVLITHWGVSGPAVLKLSAWGARMLCDRHYQLPLLINWLPQYNPETLRQEFATAKQDMPKRAIAGNCPVKLPRRLWERLVQCVGIPSEMRWAEVSNKLLNALIDQLLQGNYAIAGKGVFKEEFVTCGGVSLKEVNFKTMESRQCPGLFFAGEVLDIDGVTGGFNFQSAWTTGWIAGCAMGD